jgi:5-methylcytosine-specific restriction endonuclease McrA
LEKNFKYTIIQEIGLSETYKIDKKSKRVSALIRLVKRDGPFCVSCGKEGTKYALGLDKVGSRHWDLYSDDDSALNIDHIYPKSKGGANHIDNYQIMCLICNSKKGNSIV